jgi:hypothetical protein
MRDGLKKPAAKAGNFVSRSTPNNPDREIRAKNVPKHQGVNRFGIPSPKAKSSPGPKAVSGELVGKHAPKNAGNKAATAAPLPSMVTSVSHQKLERMLDHALANADSHKEAARYHAARHFWHRGWFDGKGRWLAGLAVIILLIIGAMFSWQRIPVLSVKAAGIRAHLSPSVPTYIPDGYRLAGPASADSGTVNIKYVQPNDSTKSYEIVQAQSNLTSQLVEQSVVPKGTAVQSSQVEGNTVYIYGQDNDAAWVNNGVLFTLKDRANLSSDEIIKIVQGINP